MHVVLVVGAGKIRWSAIGNASCKEPKPWLLKILAKHGAPRAQAKITNPPGGFHCRATNNAKGIPSVGACYTERSRSRTTDSSGSDERIRVVAIATRS
jgi:hypothetical protein